MLTLVRHGETQNNREGRLQGRTDIALTDVGRAQATAVARMIGASVHPEGGVVRIMSSPLRRAYETASIIANTLQREVEIDDRLIEIDYGIWEGRVFQEVLRDEDPLWRTDPTFAPPGGESVEQVVERVADFVREILPEDAPSEQLVIAVSHVSPIKAAVTYALSIDPMRSWQMHLDLASITRLGRRRNALVLQTFNETLHLDAEVSSRR
ncbi:MAG: histidine phosphatase family protein [Acidimicrobiia bacterium]